MRTIFFAAAAALLCTAPAAAQAGHDHGAGHAGEAGAHCPMHAAMHAADGAGTHGAGGHGAMQHGSDAVHRNAPKAVLRHAAHLGLSAAQTARLEALHARHEENCAAFMTAAASAGAAAAAVLALPTPDVAAFEAYSLDAARQKIRCRADMIRTGQEALTVLTADQRRRLEQMQQMHHGG